MREALIGLWPPLTNAPHVSMLELTGRFADAGVALRALSKGGSDVWKDIDRATVVPQICDRLRDPAIMRQRPTDLCGPFAILVEFARRRPVRYVKRADELLGSGQLTTISGNTIVATPELREKPVPLDHMDWLFAATMRDG